MAEGVLKSFLIAWIAQDPDCKTPALRSFRERVTRTRSDAEARSLVREELGELGVRLLGRYAQAWSGSAKDRGSGGQASA